MIPQRSTNLAQLCLTSEIGRDRVYSEWFDRGMYSIEKQYNIYMRHESIALNKVAAYRSNVDV